MKKILIIGSTGMLGRTMKKFFTEKGYNVSTIDRNEINLANCSYNELKILLENKNYDILINCAGLIVQRKDTSVEDFLHVNSIIPRWLANICEDLNKKMFHPTTDCVYDGLEGPYKESDKPTEKSVYGVSKSLGEPNNCIVIRSSIIGEEEHNKLSFLEWVRSNKNNNVNGYTNHLWNGVTCLEMCKIIEEIIESNNYYNGLKHYYSPIVSKADMVNYINEIYGLNIKVNNINNGILINKCLISDYTECRSNLKLQIEEQKEFWM